MFKELKKTLALAIPIMLGNVGQVLIGVIDTLMIGRLGVVALGASAFVNNLFLVPYIVLVGFLITVPVLVSQGRASGENAFVKGLFSHTFVLAIGMSLVAICGLGINYWFLDSYGQDTQVVEQSKLYYLLISLSIIPVGIYQSLKGFSEGLGKAGAPMYILFGAIALNVLLNWMLIFGHLGAPALGLVGAGWATLISRTSMLFMLLGYTQKAAFYNAFLPVRWLVCNRFSYIKSIVRMGVPSALQHLFEVGAFAGAGVIVGWVSAEALAAHQIAMSCASMAFMFPLGVSVATGIRVGELSGKGEVPRLISVCKGAFFFTGIQTSLFAGCLILFGAWLASFFVEDPAVIQMAASILVVAGIFQIVDGCQVVCIGALRGLGDVVLYMFVCFFAYWVLALPLGYWLAFERNMGAVGVWVGLAIGLGCAALLLSWRLVFFVKRMR